MATLYRVTAYAEHLKRIELVEQLKEMEGQELLKVLHDNDWDKAYNRVSVQCDGDVKDMVDEMDNVKSINWMEID